MVIQTLVVRVIRLGIVVTSGHSGQGAHSDVLVQEFVSSEIIHEIFGCDVASLIF
jgi:hypothetical protein